MATSFFAGLRGEHSRFYFPRLGLRASHVLMAILCLLMVADFVFKGLLTSFDSGKTDFTELYTSAWLWRHGQNFYDSALVTATAAHLTGCNVQIAPVYPPTTLVAIAPFTFLPWGVANLLWLCLALAGVGVTIALLIHMGQLSLYESRTALLLTCVLAFDPIHQAFHLGNIALLVVPLCFLGIALVERNHDFLAGNVLMLATFLKPQLGAWALLYCLIQRRKWVFAGAALPGVLFAVPLLQLRPLAATLAFSYQSNLRYWFEAGRPYGFTEGALPFHVNEMQVVLFQLWRNPEGVNFCAHGLFLVGISIWGYALWRGRFRAPTYLALSSLTALSFISLYHSVSDATALTLLLCWIFKAEQAGDWSVRLARVIFFLILLPGHSLLMRIAPHLNPLITQMWWWKLFVARYFVWLLLGLNAALLFALLKISGPRLAVLINQADVSHREGTPSATALERFSS